MLIFTHTILRRPICLIIGNIMLIGDTKGRGAMSWELLIVIFIGILLLRKLFTGTFNPKDDDRYRDDSSPGHDSAEDDSDGDDD